MNELLFGSAYFSIALTLIAYSIGAAIQKKRKSPFCNPILIGTILVVLVLKYLDMPAAVYQKNCAVLSHLMTPATICLSIACYEQFRELKEHITAVIVSVLAGAVSCLAMVFLMCRAFKLDHVLTISLLPKSITSAIGVAISEELGGIGAITTAAIILSGIIGNVLGPWLCKLYGLRSDIAKGVAFGTASHVIGTAKATELSALTGAVSSFSLTVCGLFTALILSFFSQFL